MLIKVIKIDINNRTTEDVDQDLLQLFSRIARMVAKLEGYDRGELSVALVDNQGIRQLNRNYRDLDQATDVLSFPMDEEVWGDVIISIERAKKQAEEYGHSLKREMCFLLTHGILHLLGYDHYNPDAKSKMRQKEEKILTDLNINRK